jgi:hypothetical protein
LHGAGDAVGILGYEQCTYQKFGEPADMRVAQGGEALNDEAV